ncbi:unnamed protein product, partial [Prorocentrum cordatum]
GGRRGARARGRLGPSAASRPSAAGGAAHVVRPGEPERGRGRGGGRSGRRRPCSRRGACRGQCCRGGGRRGGGGGGRRLARRASRRQEEKEKEEGRGADLLRELPPALEGGRQLRRHLRQHGRSLGRLAPRARPQRRSVGGLLFGGAEGRGGPSADRGGRPRGRERPLRLREPAKARAGRHGLLQTKPIRCIRCRGVERLREQARGVAGRRLLWREPGEQSGRGGGAHPIGGRARGLRRHLRLGLREPPPPERGQLRGRQVQPGGGGGRRHHLREPTRGLARRRGLQQRLGRLGRGGRRGRAQRGTRESFRRAPRPPPACSRASR